MQRASHDTSDLRSLRMMQLVELCGAKAMIPQFFLVKELERVDAYVMYNSSIFFY